MSCYPCQLITDVFILFPARLGRFLIHIWDSILGRKRQSFFLWWGLDTSLLLLEIFGLAEWYELGNFLVKRNTRPLTEAESALAATIFGSELIYRRIRIDEKAYLGPKKYRFCYVSFFTINSWGKMRDDILIHELVHIWQYQQYGASYIPRALMAQRTPEGYNYGGVNRLRETFNQQGNIRDFNFEQQADIVADYYRLHQNGQVRWGRAEAPDLHYYTYFVQQINPKLVQA